MIDGVDTERGSSVAGGRGYYLKVGVTLGGGGGGGGGNGPRLSALRKYVFNRRFKLPPALYTPPAPPGCSCILGTSYHQPLHAYFGIRWVYNALHAILHAKRSYAGSCSTISI